MISHILAIMMMASPDTAPQLVAPFKSHAECMDAAIEATKDDHRLRHPGAIAVQAEYVCLKIERITI